MQRVSGESVCAVEPTGLYRVIRNEIRGSHDHIRSSIKSLRLILELEAREDATAGGKQR